MYSTAVVVASRIVRVAPSRKNAWPPLGLGVPPGGSSGVCDVGGSTLVVVDDVDSEIVDDDALPGGVATADEDGPDVSEDALDTAAVDDCVEFGAALRAAGPVTVPPAPGVLQLSWGTNPVNPPPLTTTCCDSDPDDAKLPT